MCNRAPCWPHHAPRLWIDHAHTTVIPPTGTTRALHRITLQHHACMSHIKNRTNWTSPDVRHPYSPWSPRHTALRASSEERGSRGARDHGFLAGRCWPFGGVGSGGCLLPKANEDANRQHPEIPEKVSRRKGDLSSRIGYLHTWYNNPPEMFQFSIQRLKQNSIQFYPASPFPLLVISFFFLAGSWTAVLWCHRCWIRPRWCLPGLLPRQEGKKGSHSRKEDLSSR